MASGKNKYQSREARSLLNNILLQYWDPIGVRGIPGAEDEYSSYAAKIYVMLTEDQPSREDLMNYLYQVAIGHMGLTANENLRKQSADAANIIFERKSQFLLH